MFVLHRTFVLLEVQHTTLVQLQINVLWELLVLLDTIVLLRQMVHIIPVQLVLLVIPALLVLLVIIAQLVLIHQSFAQQEVIAPLMELIQ